MEALYSFFAFRPKNEISFIPSPVLLYVELSKEIAQAYTRYCHEHHGLNLQCMIEEIKLSGTPATNGIRKPLQVYIRGSFTGACELQVPYPCIAKNVVDKFLDQLAT